MLERAPVSATRLEPITHFLTGACLGRAGLNRRTALATATLTLASEAPDLDVLGQIRGPVFGFAHHRGFTHSFLGVPLLAALVLIFIYLFWRMRGRRSHIPGLPPRWGVLYLYACLAGLIHILLDFTNNYGVRPWWPFSERWYSWDIVFIVEPLMLVLLVGALLVPTLLSLIHEEIGAEVSPWRGRTAAIIALAGIAVLWVLRDFEHRRAVAALESRTYQDADPIRVSAFPHWLNPFRWSGVVETKNFFAVMWVDSRRPEVDPENRMEIRYKPEETRITLAAKQSYLGRVYLDWAQYPILESFELPPPGAGYAVEFLDLRYHYPGRLSAPLSAGVILNRNLKVEAEFFGPRLRRPAKESNSRLCPSCSPSARRAALALSVFGARSRNGFMRP
ncbi:MAG: metal-dependent hydrolase [Acidobacteria bacterium]|nr:metal-dependent hydrolase [Acidobacteriota bacterium]